MAGPRIFSGIKQNGITAENAEDAEKSTCVGAGSPRPLALEQNNITAKTQRTQGKSIIWWIRFA
ncbi:MAG TPA: hypothetical protein VJ440_04430 [Candidatus Brocadiaceae bacterium]|nr:hypothetical protein [Candidatus Brocadiaceae bacterium]